MELGIDQALAHGLRRYVEQTVAALALTGRPYCLDVAHPMSAYVALNARLPNFPDCDTALLWDERYGWAGALETDTSSQLTVLSYCGSALLPSPATVAQFTHDFLAGLVSPSTASPVFSIDDRDQLTTGLISYSLLTPVGAALQ